MAKINRDEWLALMAHNAKKLIEAVETAQGKPTADPGEIHFRLGRIRVAADEAMPGWFS